MPIYGRSINPTDNTFPIRGVDGTFKDSSLIEEPDKILALKTLEVPGGSLNISQSSTLTDLGGTVARLNNISGDEQISLGINTGDYKATGLLQTTLNTDIQFGGDDTTTFNIPVDGEIVVDFTNVFDARIIGHTFRLNQGKIRFHVDVQNFDNETKRNVDGGLDMEDIDFADAVGVNNDVVMEYSNHFVRYTEEEILTVTFYNVGDEVAIVRGGVVGGNPAPFIPYWRTNYFDITTTSDVPNGINGKAAEDIDKLQAVYISGEDSSFPTIYPEMSLADGTDSTKFPAIAIACGDVSTGDKTIFAANGLLQGLGNGAGLKSLDTSMYDAGDKLWLGTVGDLTATKPTANAQFIGVVVISHATEGSIYLNISQPEPLKLFGEDLTLATTTSETPQLIATFTFTPPIAGKHDLYVYSGYGAEKKDKAHILRFDVDDTPEDTFDVFTGGDDDRASQNISAVFYTNKNLTAAEHTVKVYLSSGEAGKEVFVNKLRFKAEYTGA